MDGSTKLFGEKNRYCHWCNRPLAEDSESDLCPACEESAQFREVREYVRKHTVNEFQLAEAFGIPLRKVKQWIREGRLEYRELEQKLTTLHCQNCGKEITFGNYCSECVRASYGVQGGFEALKLNDADEQMRFYDKSKRNKSKI